MHFVIDAVGNKHGGAATILIDIVGALLNDNRLERLTVFASPAHRRRFRFPDDERIELVERRDEEKSVARRIAWYEVGLEAAARQLETDLVICLNSMGVIETLPSITYIQQSLPFSEEAIARHAPLQRLRINTIGRVICRSCRAADRVVTQFDTMRCWVEHQCRIPSDLITSIPPTVALPSVPLTNTSSVHRMRRVPKEGRILYVGNASPYKLVGELMDAMPELRRSIPGATLFATWEEPDQPETGVEFLGYVPRKELRHAYEAADLLVLPSLVETCSLPLLEAMSMSLPVIAADRPYAHDVGADAFVYYNPYSANDFAQKAIQLLTDHVRRGEVGKQGRHRFEALDRTKPYERLVETLFDVARNARNR